MDYLKSIFDVLSTPAGAIGGFCMLVINIYYLKVVNDMENEKNDELLDGWRIE